jgi:hypothetical protein
MLGAKCKLHYFTMKHAVELVLTIERICASPLLLGSWLLV